MRVVIPTGQGGGADRLARVFDDFWGPLLKTNFEYGFFAGAAGQVGYELYVNKRERDGHNLLFGNMGPEMIMYALQKPPYRFPEDYQYFCRLDVDDSIVFVRSESPFKRIEDLVAEAKKRAVNVAVSRLPHPASIGMLALGNAQKARFNLVPYGGGNPTMVDGDERRSRLRRAADRRGGCARRPDAHPRHLQRRRRQDGEVQRQCAGGEQGVRHQDSAALLVALPGRSIPR